MLRHSYISRKDLEMEKMTGTQRNEIAKKWHTVLQHKKDIDGLIIKLNDNIF